MTSRERAEKLTASFGRSDWKLLTAEVERAIDEAVAEAVRAEQEACASLINLLAEAQWKARGTEEEVFASEHAAMILEDARNAIRARGQQ